MSLLLGRLLRAEFRLDLLCRQPLRFVLLFIRFFFVLVLFLLFFLLFFLLLLPLVPITTFKVIERIKII